MTKKDAVAKAEKQLGVALPAEYAAFLRDGGPGEDGTLLTLDQALTYETLRLDRPFPFTRAHAKKIIARRKKDTEAFLEPEDSIGGVLPIADAGCNDITYLVLTGPLRGSVWFGGEPGWLPIARDFREWLDTIADEPPRPAAKKKKTAPKITIAPDAHQLNLRSQRLTKVPEETFAMTKVAMIYLADNALTEVSPSFAKLARTLHSLELGPNPIRKIPGPVLAKLTKLTSLDLRGTKIEKLPKEIARLPLERLHLDENPNLDLEDALAIVRPITTLRWLSLKGCKLTKVPRALLGLVQLETLYLNDNAITTLPDELSALKLEILGIMDNRIETIPNVLEPRIRSIYFGGNPGARKEKKRFDAIRRGFVMLG